MAKLVQEIAVKDVDLPVLKHLVVSVAEFEEKVSVDSDPTVFWVLCMSLHHDPLHHICNISSLLQSGIHA